MTGLQPLTPDTVGRQRPHRLVEVLTRTRQHGVRAVVGSDRQCGEVVGQTLDPLGRREYRNHPATSRQAAEQPPAFGHQQRAVLEAEHSGDARGRILADAVAHHHVGLEAPRLPEASQAHLHRKQGRLGIGGLPQRRFTVGAIGVENDFQ